MPRDLSAVLAALAVEAGTGEFAAFQSALGGTFSGLADARRNAIARIDAADLTSPELKELLSGLPIGRRAELSVAWIADRVGARMSFETFVANIDGLWFPARDDVACVLAADDDLMVLVVDHEELITLSRVDSSEHGGQHGCRQISGR